MKDNFDLENVNDEKVNALTLNAMLRKDGVLAAIQNWRTIGKLIYREGFICYDNPSSCETFVIWLTVWTKMNILIMSLETESSDAQLIGYLCNDEIVHIFWNKTWFLTEQVNYLIQRAELLGLYLDEKKLDPNINFELSGQSDSIQQIFYYEDEYPYINCFCPMDPRIFDVLKDHFLGFIYKHRGLADRLKARFGPGWELQWKQAFVASIAYAMFYNITDNAHRRIRLQKLAGIKLPKITRIVLSVASQMKGIASFFLLGNYTSYIKIGFSLDFFNYFSYLYPNDPLWLVRQGFDFADTNEYTDMFNFMASEPQLSDAFGEFDGNSVCDLNILRTCLSLQYDPRSTYYTILYPWYSGLDIYKACLVAIFVPTNVFDDGTTALSWYYISYGTFTYYEQDFNTAMFEVMFDIPFSN